jgi:cytochrome c553
MKRYTVALAGVMLATAACATHAADLAAGKAIFEKTCAACHGADAKSPTDPSYPILAGQYEGYLRHALVAYKRGAQNDPASANVRKNPVMGAMAMQLSDQDIVNVAAWLSDQPSDLGTRKSPGD